MSILMPESATGRWLHREPDEDQGEQDDAENEEAGVAAALGFGNARYVAGVKIKDRRHSYIVAGSEAGQR